MQWYGYCCFASSFSQPQVYAGKFEKTYFPLSSLLRTLKQKSISCQSIKRHTHFCVILMRKVLIYKISCVHWRAGRLFPSAVYRKGKAGECFSMLDSEKQKHRDHCKASVARSVLISATERLSELRSSELSANGRSWMHGSSRKRSRSRVLAFRRQHTQKNNR